MMDVVVTGAGGFLGRHFTAALIEHGHRVLGVEVGQWNAFDFFRTDRNAWDLVIHCAAVDPHRTAIDNRALTVGAGNLRLDATMFEWAAHTHPKRVVYFSSSAAYPVELQQHLPEFQHGAWPSTMPRPLREDDIDLHAPEQPDAIYGWTKLTGERLAAAYRAQGGAVTVVRPFSGYGEDQTDQFPFGAFRDRAMLREDPFVVWGDGTQVRDWVHVDDVVGAVLTAVDADIDGPLNIATGVGTSMAELAAMFCAEAGYDPQFEFLTDKPAGVAYRVGDPTRLHDVYKPRVTLTEGVRRALTTARAAR